MAIVESITVLRNYIGLKIHDIILFEVLLRWVDRLLVIFVNLIFVPQSVVSEWQSFIKAVKPVISTVYLLTIITRSLCEVWHMSKKSKKYNKDVLVRFKRWLSWLTNFPTRWGSLLGSVAGVWVDGLRNIIEWGLLGWKIFLYKHKINFNHYL